MSSENQSLASKSTKAVIWSAAGSVARIALQIVTQVALARMLGPEQYGVFAVGALVIGFCNFFSDAGLAYGLIQKKIVSDIDIRFVFTWQFIFGAFLATSVSALSGSVAGFFGNEESKYVIIALSVICLLNAIAAPSHNILIRNLNFRTIQIARLVSYFIGYVVVGISMAATGFGVWSLVAAWVVQALIFLTAVYGTVRHSIKPIIWYSDARGLSGYGFTVLKTNMVNWFVGNIDNIIIGRVFGERFLGLYTTTYNMIYTPTATLLSVLQPVFFSSAAKLDNRPEKMAHAYSGFLGLITFLVLPFFAGLAVIAAPFVTVVYGPLWSAMSSLLTPLALAMPFILLFGMSTPILWVAGDPKSEVKLQIPIAILWFLSCLVASKFSSEAVAWTVFALCIFRALVTIQLAARVLALPFSRIWMAVRGGIFLSLSVVFVGVFCNIYLIEFADPIQLAIQTSIIAATFVVLTLIFVNLFPPDLANMLIVASRHLPVWLNSLILIYLRRVKIRQDL